MQGVSGRTLNGDKTEVKLEKSLWIRSSSLPLFLGSLIPGFAQGGCLVPSNSSSQIIHKWAVLLPNLPASSQGRNDHEMQVGVAEDSSGRNLLILKRREKKGEADIPPPPGFRC